ncbi:hypothetical protein KK141_15570 [Dyella sp. LX-66]|uniref:glycoside hydrolase family 127 protein n=1 Tax=unclassified Dyella TaxID=2634549 RepID=UPI001BDFBA96|nr:MULTISPECIES: glycoside hydrolase family 127 protein [unclassified Dyella]MBT2118060.1 hypothetical protein [Dyella sp. LX-1]MBT2140967.1 hypothetical protein [Dyella sp. LX-66]
MPSGCSDHRRRFLINAATAAKFCDSPIDSFWCRTGSLADAFARFDDSMRSHDDDGLHAASPSKPRPRPAPGVAAGRPGAAVRLRTLSARELRFEADIGGVAVSPLNELQRERHAPYRQLQPDAPGQD